MAKEINNLLEGRELTDADLKKIPHVKARYRCVNEGRHKSNDYVRAIPPLPSDEDIQRALTQLPEFSIEERNLPTAKRIPLLARIDDIFFALSRHISFVRSVLKLANQGYAARDGQHAEEVSSEMQRLYDGMQAGLTSMKALRSHKANQFSMSLCGVSGGGKSITMKRLLDLLPPAIYHEATSLFQLPILLIEMAYDGESVHTLATAIFDALDERLPGENYSRAYMYGRAGNGALRAVQALKIARHHGVGLILVDEAQNQRTVAAVRAPSRRRRGSKSGDIPRNDTPLVRLLVTASNDARMPICFTGTLEAQNVLGNYFPRGRRMSGRGSAMWLPLEPTFNIAKGARGEFEQAMVVLWDYQWIRNPKPLTPAMLDAFWHLTMGLPDVMVKLFSSAQQAAMTNKSETLTVALLVFVYDKEFWAVHLGLEALREGDPDLCEAFPELWHPLESAKFRELWLARRASFREHHRLAGSGDDKLALEKAHTYRLKAEKDAKRQRAEQSKAAHLQAMVEDFEPENQDLGASALEQLRKGNNPADGKQKDK